MTKKPTGHLLTLLLLGCSNHVALLPSSGMYLELTFCHVLSYTPKILSCLQAVPRPRVCIYYLGEGREGEAQKHHKNGDKSGVRNESNVYVFAEVRRAGCSALRSLVTLGKSLNLTTPQLHHL